MARSLIFLLCLTGLVSVTVSILRTVPHKYYQKATPMTWFDAQSYCRKEYTDLATILSDTDWQQLKREAERNGPNSITWTGLYSDIYGWRWTLNQTPLKNVMYSNWYPGQPDNYYQQEACGIIAAANQWHDVPCYILRPFICYDNKFTGAAKFVHVSSPVSWSDARAYCLTHHTDLASALNASDYEILAHFKMIQGDSWIGIYRDPDTWKWSDGTSASNIPWYPGEPNNGAGRENCAVLYNGYFYDERCDYFKYFYCHNLFPMTSQRLRLLMKSDGSVFDSVVQSSILEQIKQMLNENGMLKNSTVTWKRQPDGSIFQKKDYTTLKP